MKKIFLSFFVILNALIVFALVNNVNAISIVDMVPPRIVLNNGEVRNGETTRNNVTVLFYVEGTEDTFLEFNYMYRDTGFSNGQTFTVEGHYKLTLFDSYGNYTSKTFIIDRNEPVKTIVTLNDGMLDSGEATRDSVLVKYWNNNVGIDFAKYSLNSVYMGPFISGTIFTNPGNYSINVLDNAGNSFTESFVILADTTPPTILLNNGQLSNNAVTKLNVTITCYDSESGISGILYEDLLDQGVDAISEGHEFTAEGYYEVRAYDNAGNIAIVRFKIDRTVPTILLNNGNLNDEAYTNNDVTVTYSDYVSGIKSAEYYLDYEYIGLFASGSESEFSTDGEYYIIVEDNAGNISERSFTIDKTAPFAYLNGSTTFGAVMSATITFTDPNFDYATYTFGGSTYTLTNGQTFTTSGMYTIKVYDKAGNMTSKAFRVS